MPIFLGRASYMKNLPVENQSGSGWQCKHCGAFNKIVAAKFCGNCGSVHEISTNKTVVHKKRKRKSFSTQLKRNLKTFCNNIKLFFSSPKDRAFKIVVTCAVLLLMFSGILSYMMYTNVNTIRLYKGKFTDVAIDHPIYQVCKNLIGIEAIGFRKNQELAPYENISATEWNYVLKQASKYLNLNLSDSVYFSKNDEISVDSINNKLRELNENSSEITDTSRIQSFYMLEQTLFN